LPSPNLSLRERDLYLLAKGKKVVLNCTQKIIYHEPIGEECNVPLPKGEVR